MEWNWSGTLISLIQSYGMIVFLVLGFAWGAWSIAYINKARKTEGDFESIVSKYWKGGVLRVIVLFVLIATISAVSTFRPRVTASNPRYSSPTLEYRKTLPIVVETDAQRLAREMKEAGHSQSDAVENEFRNYQPSHPLIEPK